MTIEDFLLFLLLAWVVARATRFIVSDDLWKELREGIVDKLENPIRSGDDDGMVLWGNRRFYLRQKLATLITCPWCVSIYMSAAVLVAHRVVVDSVPMPIWWWLGLSMAATLWIEVTDGVKQVKVEK